ncbi:MAG: SufE family protein [Cytophagales bacterium]|nr:SufE family protein [Cytophagales bacterium]
MNPSIKERQEEIIHEFALLDGDLEMTTVYLMELGQKLPELAEEHRRDEYVVKGCQSKVWMVPLMREDKVYFEGDSNTAITKGLVSLLIRVLSGQKPQDIIEADIYFPNQIGMSRFIGTQRSNGFAAMIKQMKLYALAYKTKNEA